MFQILEYLLLIDTQFSQRIEKFLSLNFNKEFWCEDNFFAKHKEFENAFPDYIKG